VGTALMAALVDTADNWLDLKRLELTVYVDNEPATRLCQKFGFKVMQPFVATHSVMQNMLTRSSWRAISRNGASSNENSQWSSPGLN
jgi:RimJ/RimL family protein N-acetyltransferase